MTYRILSLDGGGIRGVLSAQLLVQVEKVVQREKGQKLHEYFDLITGTSSGSIVATGIAVGKTARQVVDLFRNDGKRIFPYSGAMGYLSPQRFSLIWEYGISAPKFSHSGFTAVLQEAFEEKTLSQQGEQPKLLVTSYDTITRQPIVFKSWRENEWYSDVPLWTACLCSSSAPTLFPAYYLDYGGRVCSAIDGGVGATNPITCAIAEALRFGVPIADLRILSVGAGRASKGFSYTETRSWGVLQWAGHMLDLLLNAPLDVNEYVARQIIASIPDSHPHYLRLQPLLSTSEFLRLLDFDPVYKNLLQEKLKDHPLKITDSIDDASEINQSLLTVLADCYVKYGTLAVRDEDKDILSASVKERIEQFVQSS
ncbi:patatin-like phospholipase family protein [Spirulina subsalsa]|uniref:patatin-like phospholipase family protein n=1 Tax=Spirulina subsalsa TaxID=54311 RepID=UPI0002F707FA|nr:patatin-like phospholipase family protein [Spirulina subsalsa]